MSTCKSSAVTYLSGHSYDSLPQITPEVISNYNVVAPDNSLFRFQNDVFQIVSFNFTQNESPYIASASFLELDEFGDVVLVSSVNLSSSTTFVSISLTPGFYIICIKAAENRSGTIFAHATSYAGSAFLDPRAYSGEGFVPDIEIHRQERECHEPLFFEVVDGSLPLGLQMDWEGTIYGQLPNLDCLEDKLSPSMDWWYTENDGAAFPWGRQWRFKVRVSLQNFPDVNNDRWFCIRVHNNWDFDRDRFLKLPMEHDEEQRVVTPAPKLPAQCVPCEESPSWRLPSTKLESDCNSCADDTNTRVELIPIPKEIQGKEVAEIMWWYERSYDDIDLNSEEVKEFLLKLKDSETFQILRERYGYKKPDELSDKHKQILFVSAQKLEEFLQLAAKRLDEEKDSAYTFELWRTAQNQILPIYVPWWSGEEMKVTLS